MSIIHGDRTRAIYQIRTASQVWSPRVEAGHEGTTEHLGSALREGGTLNMLEDRKQADANDVQLGGPVLRPMCVNRMRDDIPMTDGYSIARSNTG